MTDARAQSFAAPKKARSRAFCGETARRVLADSGWARGQCVQCLSMGQFSLIDWIDALADSMGGAPEFVIATWTAARADLEKAEEWIRGSRLARGRWILDRSLETRHPGIFAAIMDRFGRDAVRVANTHAKFVLLAAGDWRVVVTTSANLNRNTRIEHFSATDDADEYAFWLALVDDIFASEGLSGLDMNRKLKRDAAAASQGVHALDLPRA